MDSFYYIYANILFLDFVSSSFRYIFHKIAGAILWKKLEVTGVGLLFFIKTDKSVAFEGGLLVISGQ